MKLKQISLLCVLALATQAALFAMEDDGIELEEVPAGQSNWAPSDLFNNADKHWVPSDLYKNAATWLPMILFGYGCSPLHQAVETGDLERIMQLVEAGAKVNARCHRAFYHKELIGYWYEYIYYTVLDWAEKCRRIAKRKNLNDRVARYEAIKKYLKSHGGRYVHYGLWNAIRNSCGEWRGEC